MTAGKIGNVQVWGNGRWWTFVVGLLALTSGCSSDIQSPFSQPGDPTDSDDPVQPTPPADTDEDGDGWTVQQGDCDDGDPQVNPAADELCDAVDNDCDELVDEGFDGDQDGWTSCGGDCDDCDPTINPAAAEICEAIDN